MFIVQTAALSRDLSELRAEIQWQDELRQSLYSANPSLAPIALDNAALSVLRRSAPPKLAWQVFDACAAVTRIYALMERAICELVEEYVRQIGLIFQDYSKLNESLRVQHRSGVGHILSKWSPTRTLYSNLSEDAIAAGLADGLRGNGYKLLSDAFLTDTDNYRSDVITRIFNKLGVSGAFDRAVKIIDAKLLCERILSAGDTPSSYLNRLVSERNEAAHGSLSSVSSVGQLLEYAEFVEILVECLAMLLRSQIVDSALAAGTAFEVARIVKKYSNCTHGARASIAAELRPGQVYFGGRGLMHEVRIEELRVGPATQASLNTDISTEFGVKLSRELPAGAILVRLDG